MKDFIEQQITEAVRKMLAGRVNEIFREWEFLLPVIEFGVISSSAAYGGLAVSPTVSLASCERTEKERIIKQDTYSLSISFTLQEHEDGELYCYGYAYAFGKALGEDITLGGIADRAVITGKKYLPPKKPNCGEGWGLVLTLRVTVEGIGV
jgi:hypothetical protein